MSNAHEDSYITNPQATSLEIWKSTEGRSWKKTTPRVPRGKTRKDANRSQKNTVIPVTKALGTGTLCWLSMGPIDSENTCCSTKKEAQTLTGWTRASVPGRTQKLPALTPKKSRWRVSRGCGSSVSSIFHRFCMLSTIQLHIMLASWVVQVTHSYLALGIYFLSPGSIWYFWWYQDIRWTHQPAFVGTYRRLISESMGVMFGSTNLFL